MSKTQIISKLLGTAAAGIVLYDSHKMGTVASAENQRNTMAKILPDTYINSMQMSGTSTIGSGAKRWYFNKIMDTSFITQTASVKGYFMGMLESAKDNVVTLALAAGAIGLKGFGGKLCGLGVALTGAKFFIFDVLGFGKKKYFNKNN